MKITMLISNYEWQVRIQGKNSYSNQTGMEVITFLKIITNLMPHMFNKAAK